MSNLWPEGNDATLLQLVNNYLKGLQQNKSVDEETRDSLTVAVDCLSSIIDSGNVTVSKDSNLSLISMYEQCINSSNKNNINNRKSENENDSKNENSNNLSQEELNKRLTKFSQFLKVLNSKNFFKETKEGSEEYYKLLDTARKQWNQRFPQLTLDSIDLIKNNNINKVDTQKAESMKAEGNAALQKKDFKTAISKYSDAIKFDPNNAVYYSNRSAAYCYIKDYDNAAKDARKATELDGKYVKAWVRLGVSEFELGNYEAAQTAYNQALGLTPATDKNWEFYMERVQLCEQKLSGNTETNMNDDNNDVSNPFGGGQMPDMSQLGNLLGGNPNLSNLFENMGGMEGLNNLMSNPMFSQMASNMMKDPNMMANLGNMMNNPQAQSAMSDLFGGGGGAAASGASDTNDNDNDAQGTGASGASGGGGSDWNDALKKMMADPQKMQDAMGKVMDDAEVKELMKDAEVASLVTRIKNGDYTALMEASKKPDLMATVKRLMKKYMQ